MGRYEQRGKEAENLFTPVRPGGQMSSAGEQRCCGDARKESWQEQGKRLLPRWQNRGKQGKQRGPGEPGAGAQVSAETLSCSPPREGVRALPSSREGKGGGRGLLDSHSCPAPGMLSALESCSGSAEHPADLGLISCPLVVIS